MLRLRTQFPCVYSEEGSSSPPSSPSQACLALHTCTVFPWDMHGLQSTRRPCTWRGVSPQFPASVLLLEARLGWGQKQARSSLQVDSEVQRASKNPGTGVAWEGG